MSDPQTLPTATLRCLGAFEVILGQAAVTAFPTDKIRALLAYLALEANQPHRRELLAGLLWPEMPGPLALTNLRLALHRLRQTLDEAVPASANQLLLSTRQTIQLNPAAVTVDVVAFQTLLAACNTHPHTDLATCEPCLARLAEAVTHYRGELLAGFGLFDAPPFEEWLLLRRETLHQQALAALDRLILAYEQRGDDGQTHRYASQQLALDPSREEAHRQVMRALARLGLREQALAQFESCRRLLREQLDVDPDLETVALHEQIRTGRLGRPIGSSAEFPATESASSTHAPGTFLSSVSSNLGGDATDPPPPTPTRPDWREAVEIGKVYGRQTELAHLEQWLVHARCRLVAVLGIGGVGKTTVAAVTAHAVAPHFDRVLWRSLLNAPPLDELLPDILQRLADEQLVEIPKGLDRQLALLLSALRRQRVLLVLDNLESILHPDQPGHPRPGYAGYAQLLRQIVEQNHQSCLLITSRERPQSIGRWEEDFPAVRTLPLEGLDAAAGQAMLNARGVSGSHAEVTSLVEHYSGNPLALKLVAQTVQELFHNDIGAFLAVEALFFDDIRTVLDHQFARLSPLEQELLIWLAIEREPVSLTALRENLVQPGAPHTLIEALRALQRRSLVSQNAQGFLLQNVITEYLTEYLVEQVCQEILEFRFGISDSEADDPLPKIQNPKSSILNRHALFKAQAKEYVRQSQVRLLLAPIATRLVKELGQAKLAVQLHCLVDTLRAGTLGSLQDAPGGYAAANILHLLIHLDIDVRNYDFSQLSVRQAYLRGVTLPGVNFARADLTGSIFTDTFRSMTCVAFSPDTHYLAAGSDDGTICLWQVADRQPCGICTGHTSFIWSITFSPDGRWLASASEDSTVRLWDARTRQLLYTLTGHTHWLKCVVFSPDGTLLASGGGDQTVRLWDARTGEPLKILHGHSGGVWSVAFSPDGRRLASASEDSTVRLWELQTGNLIQTLQSHHGRVTAVAFSPDGALLASSAHDGTVRLWDAHSGHALHIFRISADWITSVVFSPDGSLLASACQDRVVRVWEVGNPPGAGQPRPTLYGHTDGVGAVVFSRDGLLLATTGDHTVRLWDARSGQAIDILHGYPRSLRSATFCLQGTAVASCGLDRIVRLWDARSGQLLHTLQGHANGVLSLAASLDGALLASGSADQTVRLWDVDKGQIMREFHGHTDDVTSAAFSPHGALLASGSADQTVRLWDVDKGQTIRTLRIHQAAVMAVAFSPDGTLLASGGRDRIICVSDVRTGEVLATLHGHTKWIKSVAFRPRADGSRVLLASGSDEEIVRLWDVSTAFTVSKAEGLNTGIQRGEMVKTLHGHTNVIESVTFSPDGRLLASASYDGTVRLWNADTGEAIHTLQGHTNWVRSVAFSPDGTLVVSGSDDETSRLWDVRTGACLKTLRAEGPYAGMNITGVTGISAAQKAALKALGAVEDGEARPAPKRQDAKRRGRQGEGLTSDQPLSLSTALAEFDDPILADSDAPAHNLPPQATPFIGRTQELTAILAQLADPNVRLLTLTGAGGMGKTRLAIAAAQAILDSRFWILDLPAQSESPNLPKSGVPSGPQNPKFPDGVIFVPLAAISRTSEVAISVATALGLALTGGDPQQMVTRFLQTRRLLLILDNFEHLMAAPVIADAPSETAEESAALLVAALLQAAPGVKILVTSRQKLNLQGEHLYPIQGMDVAQATSLAAAAQSTSLRLFVQSVQRVQPGFVLTEAHLPALLRICRLVGGMPLGLEMAAAWAEVLPLEEIAQEIEKSLDFLAVDWPALPARQRSMRAVFEWSWRLLREDERQVLRQLAVFRGGFTRRAAEQVAGASLRLLTSLVQKSLLRRIDSGADAGTGRYDLHELLRQFAAGQLAALPEEQRATAARHSSFYLSFVAACERRLARNEPKEAASEIQAELDNLRQAWLWSAQHTNLPDLDAAAYTLRLFYTFTSLEPEGELLFQRAIEKLRTQAAPQSQALLSKLLGFQAILQLGQHKHPAALAAAQEAVLISAGAPAGQPYVEGETFGHLAWGMVLSLESSSPQARTLLEQALQLAQRYQPANTAGAEPIESLYDAEWVAHLSLRDLDRYEDNYPSAIAHVQRALQLCRTLAKRRGEMNCLTHLADPLIKVHNYEGARQTCAQGLALARALNNRWGAGFSLHHLGDATRLLGRYGEAQTLLEQAHTVMQFDSDLAEEAMVAALLGHLYNLMGASEQATAWFDRFSTALQQLHSSWAEAELEGLLPLALFRCHTGEYELARDSANRCLQLAQTYGWRQSAVRALILCGQAEQGRQQAAAAATSYREALTLCHALNDDHLAAEAEAGLARLALERGDLAQGQTHVAAILLILENHPQAGMDEPFEIYLTCHQVLAACGDARAAALLQRGYDLLQAYARQIPDHDLRQSFLNKEPVHCALNQAYLRAHSEPST